MNLLSVIRGKCPQCNMSDIFSSNGNFLLFKSPKMHSRCENCNFKFEKEPGFFFGAMFVSYALIVAQFVTVFILSKVLLNMSVMFSAFAVILTSILLSTMNFRLSRIIWIYIFSNTKKEI